MVSDFEQLIRLLTRHNVEFVIVGGLAATIHGAATVTYDLDICYRRSNKNIERLCRALFSNAQTVHLFGCEVRVLSLRALIAEKRSTGRNKDAIAVLELEQLLKAQERESRDPPAEP